MSDQAQPIEQAPVELTPEQIKERESLQSITVALQELSMFKNLVNEAMFAGGKAQAVSKLSAFLHQTYLQVHAQYEAHPLIKQQG